MSFFRSKHRTDNLPPRIVVPPAPVLAPAPPPAPVRPPLALGLNVHAITPAHLAACARFGVTRVRTTLYAPDLAGKVLDLDHALGADLDVLLVLHGGDPATWPGLVADVFAEWPALTALAVQVGNEPDAPDALTPLTPSQYVDVFRACVAAAPPLARLVAAGCGTDEGVRAYPAALVRALVSPTAYGVHAYGPPPLTQLRQRVQTLRDVVGGAAPVWCTEFGIAPKDASRAWSTPAEQFDAVQALSWRAVAEQGGDMVQRAYGYCLDVETDQPQAARYGILRADGRESATAAWLASTQGITRA